MKRKGQTKKVYPKNNRKEILPKLSPEIKAIEFSNVVDMRNKIQEAFNSLTDAQKLVIDLAYYEGVDESVIAERLKIPVSSVKSKLRLANASLMKQIFNDRI
jgi:RNA polymerase sigma-70 factor (ECF subfamily)